MDPRLTAIENTPENQVFSIVFYPDRIYHARYLNATRSPRYRYYVHEVRNKVDNMAMKGQVYFDGALLAHFLHIEYRASRLVELVRGKERVLKDCVLAYVKVIHKQPSKSADAMVRLDYDDWIGAYQVWIWGSLEPPPTIRREAKVAAMMGREGSFTRVRR